MRWDEAREKSGPFIVYLFHSHRGSWGGGWGGLEGGGTGGSPCLHIGQLPFCHLSWHAETVHEMKTTVLWPPHVHSCLFWSLQMFQPLDSVLSLQWSPPPHPPSSVPDPDYVRTWTNWVCLFFSYLHSLSAFFFFTVMQETLVVQLFPCKRVCRPVQCFRDHSRESSSLLLI